MKKLIFGALALITLGIVGSIAGGTTEVHQEAGYGHPLIDGKI